MLLFGGLGRTWLDWDRGRELPFGPRGLGEFHYEVGVSVSGVLRLLRFDLTKSLCGRGLVFDVWTAKPF